MDINEIVQMIGSTGFPIVMCLFMYKSNIELSQMISNNTKSIDLLKESIDALLRKDDRK